eukprot:2378731-Pleurochrysis_carterae.AAC.1
MAGHAQVTGRRMTGQGRARIGLGERCACLSSAPTRCADGPTPAQSRQRQRRVSPRSNQSQWRVSGGISAAFAQDESDASKTHTKGCERGCERVCERGRERGCKRGCERACERGWEKGSEKGCEKGCERGCERGWERGCER